MPYRLSKPWGQTKPPVGTQIDLGDPINNQLVGYWLLNEGGGLRAFDYSGRNNTGTLTNGPIYKPGKFNAPCLSFDGVDDFVRFAFSVNFSSITLAAWVNTKSATIQEIVNADGIDNFSNRFWQFRVNSTGVFDTILFNSAGTAFTASSVATVNNGKFRFLVGTMDSSGNMKNYIDGKLDGTQTLTGSLKNGTEHPRIGGGGGQTGGSTYFLGKIDDVRIYNRALSASEIMRLYTEPFAGLSTPKRRIISQVAAAASTTTTSSMALMGVGM